MVDEKEKKKENNQIPDVNVTWKMANSCLWFFSVAPVLNTSKYSSADRRRPLIYYAKESESSFGFRLNYCRLVSGLCSLRPG